MMTNTDTNPILPAAGVSRTPAAGTSARPLVGPDEDAPSNLLRRGAAEVCTLGPKAKLLKCKKNLILATMNVQTIRDVSRAEELARSVKEQGIAICGIQEHRIVHEDGMLTTLKTSKVLDQYMITASAWRNEAQAATGGVGIMLNQAAQRTLISVTRVSDRIITASFKSNPILTVIVSYAPTNVSEDSKKKAFYDKLREAVETVTEHNFLMILSDFNARLGPSDARFAYGDETNDNGTRLLELMEDYSLLASNTLFEKRRGKIWTWLSPHNTKHQIDFILTRKKWRNSIVNSQAYRTFATIGSDHRVVATRVRLSLRAKRKETIKRVKYNWKQLEDNLELQERYAVEIRNRFQLLGREEGETATDRYQRFVRANEEAAEVCLEKIPKAKKRVRSSDPRVVKAREEMATAYNTFVADCSSTSRQVYAEKKTALFNTYNAVEEEHLTQKVREVEVAHANQQHAKSWQLINEISGRRSAQATQIKGESNEQRVEAWYNHFKNLLGNPPTVLDEDEEIDRVLTDLPIDDCPFTQAEYVKAKTSLKSGKSCGEDGVVPEVLKYVPVDNIILDFINQAYDAGELPDQWNLLNIVPIPKSGDLTSTDNYRGISLSSVPAKTFNRMILNRLRPVLDPLLRPQQNGFREKRTTVGQVLALRRIIEGVRNRNLPAIMTFIDFRKAFDTIHRGKLIRILRAYGIPEKLVQAISRSYEHTRAKVNSPDGETDTFNILAGVLQGDTLAPYLFIIVLDHALRKAITGREEELGVTLAPRRSRRVPAVTVTDLDYADDIALISNTAEQARKLLLAVETECLRVGLQLNSKKTKVLAFNTDDTVVCTSSGETLKVEEDFRYLGAWISSSLKDLKTRRAIAWKVLHDMRKMWKSGLSRKIKRNLFVSTVESVLLYGAETWTLTAAQEKSMDGCYTRMLRMAQDVSWMEHMNNVDLYAGLPLVTTKIRQRRLRLAGHSVRHPDLISSKLVLWEPMHGKATRGARRITYVDVLKKDTGYASADELRSGMLDRDVWRGVISRARVAPVAST